MRKVLLTIMTLMIATSVYAKGGGYHSSSSHSYQAVKPYGYGTGSSSSHERVNGYVKSNGEHVSSYMRTSKDTTQYNNFSTKGNYNPYTNQYGTKPARH
ncbi:hypothetical protein [Dickeya fangzhongdai]|uniref:hypothetical protein n=1 Tax=Dickeya fangzhongdai TaxID=1778540 RepID=UPI0008FFC63E|nr:hypothetical protein [Dickeya fangzhongdai]WPD73896.1 hypothetical protein OGM23_11955 [Dickeya fangzhongdai]